MVDLLVFITCSAHRGLFACWSTIRGIRNWVAWVVEGGSRVALFLRLVKHCSDAGPFLKHLFEVWQGQKLTPWFDLLFNLWGVLRRYDHFSSQFWLLFERSDRLAIDRVNRNRVNVGWFHFYALWRSPTLEATTYAKNRLPSLARYWDIRRRLVRRVSIASGSLMIIYLGQIELWPAIDGLVCLWRCLGKSTRRTLALLQTRTGALITRLLRARQDSHLWRKPLLRRDCANVCWAHRARVVIWIWGSGAGHFQVILVRLLLVFLKCLRHGFCIIELGECCTTDSVRNDACLWLATHWSSFHSFAR